MTRQDPNRLWTAAALAALAQADRETDAWLADHDPQPPTDHRGLTAYRLQGGTITRTRPEVVTPVLTPALTDDQADALVAAGGSLVTWNGRTYDGALSEALGTEPSFDYVTQHATTPHRDRGAFTRWPLVRVRRVDRDTGGRTYVSALVPAADATVVQRRASAVPLVLTETRPRVVRRSGVVTMHSEHSGRTYRHAVSVTVRGRRAVVDGTAPWVSDRVVSELQSRRRGRTTARRSLGWWSESTYAAGPESTRTVLVAAYRVQSHREHRDSGQRIYGALSAADRLHSEALTVCEALQRTYGAAPLVVRSIGGTILPAAYTAGMLAADALQSEPWSGPVAARDWTVAVPERITVERTIPALDLTHRPADATAWHLPERSHASTGVGRTGRPPVTDADAVAVLSPAAVRARLTSSPEAAAWCARLLQATERVAVSPGASVKVGAGVTLTFDPTALDQATALTFTEAATGRSWSGSWRGRRALAQRAAVATLTR